MDRNETEEVVMSQSAHDALMDKAKAEAIEETKKAKAEGVLEGRKVAHDRIAAIVADEKVKGKEATALDLALKSPDMVAADVVAFVAGLPAAQPASSTHKTIEQRMAGQGADLALGGPIGRGANKETGTQAVLDPSAIYSNRSKAVAR